MKKIPMRKCVVSNERLPKNELIRIVRTPEKDILIDPKGKINGHGAYIKLSKEVIDLARKTKALERALEVKIDESIYEELLSMLK